MRATLSSVLTSAFFAALTVCALAANTDKTPIGGNRWQYASKSDQLDGKEIRQIGERAFDTVLYPQRRPEIRNKTAVFFIRCNKGTTEAYFEVENSLIASDRTHISFRIDAGLPVKDRVWSASTDNTAIGFWSSKPAIRFVKSVLDAQKLFIRVEHNIFGTTEATFNLAEIKTAINPIREACKW